MKKNPEFASLRSRPDFQKLVAELEKATVRPPAATLPHVALGRPGAMYTRPTKIAAGTPAATKFARFLSLTEALAST
jgi:hypothetical protein